MTTAQIGPPLWLLAEITYRCPLHCVFCYNPTDFAKTGVDDELSTDDWLRVLREARAAGSVQCGFSGGEPLLRDDLEILVAEAHRLGFYTNLLTSGVGLNETRIAKLKQAGLAHIQLSFQDSTKELNDFLSHTKTFELKQNVAHLIKSNDWPMVLNCVIHRLNIDYIDKIIEMAVELGAEYLELANNQYYSWAQVNRDQLLPSREQLQRAERITNEYRAKLGDKIRMMGLERTYVINDMGKRVPTPVRVKEIGPGETGYLIAGIKDVGEARAGETVTEAARPGAALDGYAEPKPMVFCGIYPVDGGTLAWRGVRA